MKRKPIPIPVSSELAARFWTKVQRAGLDECWEWRGARESTGYGVLTFHGQKLRAHRIAVALIHGDTELLALHRCNNPPCCNPAHLYAGDERDNTLQCVADGRAARVGCCGEKSGKAKLTESDVREIHHLYAGGMSQRALARMFRVCKTQIGAIVRGEQWNYLQLT